MMQVSLYGLIMWVPWRIDGGGQRMLLRLHQITDPSLVQERHKGCLCERERRKKTDTERQKARDRPPGDGDCV